MPKGRDQKIASVKEGLEDDEVASLKFTVDASLRDLEKLIGREAVKDFLRDYPLPF